MGISPDRTHSLPSWMIQLPLQASPQSNLQAPLDLGRVVKEVKAELKQVIFYFYEDNCADCDRFLRDSFTQRALFEKANKSYQFIAINVMGERLLKDLYGKTLSEEDFADSMGILFAPSLVFLDEVGDAVVKLNGYTAPHKFRLALDYGSGRGRTAGSRFRDYLQRMDPIASNKELNRESFFLKPPYRLSRHEQPAIRPLLVLFEQQNPFFQMHDLLHGHFY